LKDSAVDGTHVSVRAFRALHDELKISSPIVSALAMGCSADAEFLDQFSGVCKNQQSALLLILATQYLFAGVSSEQRLSDLAIDKTLVEYGAFKAFCQSRQRDLIELVEKRTLSTNLVERAAYVLPILGFVQISAGDHISLIEVGCSAGFNLLFDKYAYHYEDFGSIGDPGARIHLRCKCIGAPLPLENGLPVVNKRAGIDLQAVNPDDEADRRWLRSMMCPEWTEERAKVSIACDLLALSTLRIEIGDVVERLPSLVHEMDGTLCIIASHCIGQLSDETKAKFYFLLEELSRRRCIYYFDVSGITQDSPDGFRNRWRRLMTAGVSPLKKQMPSRVIYRHYEDGAVVSTQQVAEVDGFGSWIDWSSLVTRELDSFVQFPATLPMS
jgi:hypothetical protein